MIYNATLPLRGTPHRVFVLTYSYRLGPGSRLLSITSISGNVQFKVEAYPIPGSFLKLKYLKTELNVDNGTYAIV